MLPANPSLWHTSLDQLVPPLGGPILQNSALACQAPLPKAPWPKGLTQLKPNIEHNLWSPCHHFHKPLPNLESRWIFRNLQPLFWRYSVWVDKKNIQKKRDIPFEPFWWLKSAIFHQASNMGLVPLVAPHQEVEGLRVDLRPTHFPPLAKSWVPRLPGPCEFKNGCVEWESSWSLNRVRAFPLSINYPFLFVHHPWINMSFQRVLHGETQKQAVFFCWYNLFGWFHFHPIHSVT